MGDDISLICNLDIALTIHRGGLGQQPVRVVRTMVPATDIQVVLDTVAEVLYEYNAIGAPVISINYAG